MFVSNHKGFPPAHPGSAFNLPARLRAPHPPGLDSSLLTQPSHACRAHWQNVVHIYANEIGVPGKLCRSRPRLASCCDR